MGILTAFPPIVDEHSRVLILGSMPGSQSLAAGQYYAHPQNQFWRIMEALLGVPMSLHYADRTALLLKNRIALWDVIHSCQRSGSLDTAIRQEQVNDFDAFFNQYPAIHTVACNGTKAWDTFRRKAAVEMAGRTLYRLPSTSPAHTMKLMDKVSAWQVLLSHFRVEGDR